MQIKVDLKIFLFLLLFFITKQIEIYAILMIFAFLHECGHLIAGIIFGFKPNSIAITPFGLCIKFGIYCGDYNKKIGKGNSLNIKKIIIAIAGPLTNIILMIIASIFVQKQLIVYANLLIAIFNLLPIYPLDGGRILKNIIHIIQGLEKSYEYANKIANISMIILTAIASIGILYLKNIAIVVIILYLWFLVIKENKRYNLKREIYLKFKNI